MTPTALAERLVALDWSATSLQHQLAIAAAVETLQGLAIPEPVVSNVVVLFERHEPVII